MRLIIPERCVHRIDLAHQLRPAERRDPAAQLLDVDGNFLADLDLTLSLARIIAEQEILLGSAALEQLDRDPAVQLLDCARVLGGGAIDRHRVLAVEVDAADQDDTDDADDADRGDLVRETKRGKSHLGFKNSLWLMRSMKRQCEKASVNLRTRINT